MGTIAAQVTDAGIIAPSYADILAQLKNSFWSIYGTDANLDPDTQDGQFLAVLAQAIYDSNQVAVAVYQAFSPLTAQGAGLSSVVKINGLRRRVATNSQVVVTLVGQAGTVITNGIVGDNQNLGTQWALPPSVTIPVGGQVTVTATSVAEGAVTAAPNTITRIITPTLGWQSSDNADAAVVGDPVETDAELRQRQAQSTSLVALTVLESIYAAVAALSGVLRLAVYENDGDATDADGIPAHSISVVALGGNIEDIAETIAQKKTPGTGTYGDISTLVTDERGVPSTINQFQLDVVPLAVEITIQALPGYTSVTGDAIKANVAAFISDLDIGEDSYLGRLFGAASLTGEAAADTFYVTIVEQSRDGDPPAAGNVTIAFNEAASCSVDDIVLTVLGL